MNNFYHLLFYHIYKSIIKSPDPLNKYVSNLYPALVTLMVLSFIIFSNFILILLLFGFFNIDLYSYFSKIDIGVNISVPILVIFYFINYLYFVRNKRYRKIISFFQKKSLKKRKVGARLTLIYGLVSIFLVFIFAPIIRN